MKLNVDHSWGSSDSPVEMASFMVPHVCGSNLPPPSPLSSTYIYVYKNKIKNKKLNVDPSLLSSEFEFLCYMVDVIDSPTSIG